jgi:GrpB-like predicted nucleotidyltransferase (UPF0157 family)
MTPAVSKDGNAWSNASEDRISLVDPDSSWPAQYEAETHRLRAILPRDSEIRLEHFGSTAIANLRAKPIIDILLIHPDTAYWPKLIDPVTSLGYVYWAENPRRDRMFFVKGMPPFGRQRTHHLHVRMPGDAKAALSFRDKLRGDPRLASRYAALKADLAARFPNDREAYTNGKAEFVARALG